MKRRKICVVTGSRAEYGLLYWLMKEIKADDELELQIIATGMHLSPEFGLTYQIIEKDNFFINEKVEMLLSSDTTVGVAKSIGLGVIGFADAVDRLKPDIMVVLGDRYEILAAAQVALVENIPIAHIHGGETTEGAIDEAIRHSITKMAQIHFAAAEPYRNRIIQLGEQPQNVFNFGAPGLDNISKIKLLSQTELEQSIDFNLGNKFFLVTYHPVTREPELSKNALEALFVALDVYTDYRLLITKPNSDTGGRIICKMIDEYRGKYPGRVYSCSSLGQLRYLSAMKYCSAVVGNSSSGLIEAPILKRPTVNIGERQKGRLKADSVIDCVNDSEDIIKAIRQAISYEFCGKLPYVTSVYGFDNVSAKIKNVLKDIKIKDILKKKFYDLNF